MTAANVIDASELFARRNFPVDSLVRHPTHGFGSIREIDGARRLVAFRQSMCKKLTAIPREDWPAENPLNVRFVKSVEIVSHWLFAEELVLISLPTSARNAASQIQADPFGQAAHEAPDDMCAQLPDWLPA